MTAPSTVCDQRSEPSPSGSWYTVASPSRTTVPSWFLIVATFALVETLLDVVREVQQYALARVPLAGETRGNLAAGGTGNGVALTERDQTVLNLPLRFGMTPAEAAATEPTATEPTTTEATAPPAPRGRRGSTCGLLRTTRWSFSSETAAKR